MAAVPSFPSFAVVQHVSLGNEATTWAIPAEALSADELAMLRRLSGKAPTEGEVSDEEVEAVEALAARGTRDPSVLNRDASIVALCQLWFY